MELKSIIWLVILVIGIIVKIAESAKERKQQGGNFQAPRSSNGDEPILTWEEVFARSRSSERVPTVEVKKTPVPQAKAYSVSSEEAEILAQQQQYQQWAEQLENSSQTTAFENQVSESTSAPEESSAAEECDYAAMIRLNRTEAVVLSEILAPPVAMRCK